MALVLAVSGASTAVAQPVDGGSQAPGTSENARTVTSADVPVDEIVDAENPLALSVVPGDFEQFLGPENVHELPPLPDEIPAGSAGGEDSEGSGDSSSEGATPLSIPSIAIVLLVVLLLASGVGLFYVMRRPADPDALDRMDGDES